MSYGKESVPVSCVNSLDNNYSEYISKRLARGNIYDSLEVYLPLILFAFYVDQGFCQLFLMVSLDLCAEMNFNEVSLLICPPDKSMIVSTKSKQNEIVLVAKHGILCTGI